MQADGCGFDSHLLHQFMDREYHNEYYRNNPKRQADIRRYKAEAVARNKKFVDDYLKTHPCVKCGEQDIIVLEFDHRNSAEKDRSVSKMATVGVSVEKLKAEMDKCDVLCANCHRRKTFLQFGWK